MQQPHCVYWFGVIPIIAALAACAPAPAQPVPGQALPSPYRATISAHFEPCWNYDGQAENLSNYQVLLMVTTDATGTIREAEVSPQNKGDMSNPLYIAFTQRALAAVMNYQCADLGPYLPANMLGQDQTFTFLYKP